MPPPLLALVPVYFWCLMRPDLMTPVVVLTIGFAEDVMSGGPPGVWTLSFVLTYGLVARYRENFAGLAGLAAVVGFAVAATFACAMAYSIGRRARVHHARRAFSPDRFQHQRTRHDRAVLRARRLGGELAAS